VRRFVCLLILTPTVAFAQSPPRDVDIAAPDGVTLRATYFAASRPGPAVVLLHMCNTTRQSWEAVARPLSAAGISALTIDNRGFGESGGARFDPGNPDVQRQLGEKWPDDFDAALAWLVSQPGIDRNRIGVGGGSCGVNNAVKLASRHTEVRSLVLLAGGMEAESFTYLEENRWLPIFTAAAADDQYDGQVLRLMQWVAEATGNPRNTFAAFKDGRHGTEIFVPHPELPRQIVSWFVGTLVTSPADPAATVTPKRSAAAEFWALARQPQGAARAAQFFRTARTRDPNAFLFPEFMLNQLAYARLQAGDAGDAVELFKVNADAYPSSSNAQDSLADGYVARGQNDLALAAAQKCLELLPADTINERFKASIRQAAEEKIAKLKSK
jgi:dienelactone hydrolase